MPASLEQTAAAAHDADPASVALSAARLERKPSAEEEEIAFALAALSSLNHVQAGAAASSTPEAQAPSAAKSSAAVDLRGQPVDPRMGQSPAAADSNSTPLSGAALVASKLQAAAAAAAAAAAPLANGVSSLATSSGASVASQLQSAASAGTSTAVATFATVSAGAPFCSLETTRVYVHPMSLTPIPSPLVGVIYHTTVHTC